MRTQLVLVFTLLSAAAAFGQEAESGKANKDALRRLAFLAGHWKGEGWRMGPDRQKHAFTQTEAIQFKLDSTVLLIEGRGMANGHVIHDALAVVSYNKADNTYAFQSYLANGRGGKFKAELLDNKFYWYPNENMRYVIYRNEKGQWYERGEMKREQQWFQFFEMTLDKQ